jgi:preprotein translocase subunit SecE
MAITDEKDEQQTDAEEGVGEASSEAEGADTQALATASEDAAATDDGEEDEGAGTLGSERYVHAAFFVAGILAAYIASKTLALAWSSLANWPAAVRAVPALVSLSEEQRDSYALVAGAGVGALTVIQAYRKETVRTWANEVAAELSKVTWPNREAVLNGTLVVVVASAIATVYVTILDRIWSFLTTLVYGA